MYHKQIICTYNNRAYVAFKIVFILYTWVINKNRYVYVYIFLLILLRKSHGNYEQWIQKKNILYK